jgi:four helix bundle protein
MMNDESQSDLKHRTKEFALRIIKLYSALPKSSESQTIGRQVLRSGTSVGAQYREAFRARSSAEFISKMQSALQELDETGYWLELLVEGNLVKAERLQSLQDETNQLTAIFVASIKTAKSKR